MRLSQPVDGACTAGPGNRGPGGANGPRPNASPRPTTGAAQTVTVPTTVPVAESSAASASDLTEGDCIQAVGPKDSSGTVTATSLSIVPAGPSGCFTGGRGGLGGGGGFGRGAGGGAPTG